MAEKSQNADSGKEIKEKKINKKEKTTQQQKGLPTLSYFKKNISFLLIFMTSPLWLAVDTRSL